VASRWIGASVLRLEDPALLTGEIRFVADIMLPNMLHACFVRSTYAHARILKVDVSPALLMPGVVAALSARDLPHEPMDHRLEIEGLKRTPQPALAGDRVRFVGEPIAIVLAASRNLAEDAAEKVVVDYEPLPANPDVDVAMDSSATPLFPELASNVIYRQILQFGSVEEAFAAADHVFPLDFHHNRFVAAPIETQGCIAEFEKASQQLTVWSSTQSPHLLRSRLASTIRLPEHKVRVIAPAVGGGFGQKIPLHPEEAAVALAARHTGRVVKWIEDRSENLMAAPHAKEQTIHLELAVKSNGKFLGMRARIVGDSGAYSFNNSTALIEPYMSARLLPSVYTIEHYECEVIGVVTNKSPIAPYRGVGFTAGHTAREILIDNAARGLRIDPAKIRRQNMITAPEFPYTSCTGMIYDSGSYQESLDMALSLAGYDAFRAKQQELRKRKQYLGLGLSPYVEPTAFGSEGGRQSGWHFVSHDLARVSMDPAGNVTVATGTPSQGQGHETTLAQLAADRLGIEPADVRVTSGDTLVSPISVGGTRASRAAVISGGAVLLASEDLRSKLLKIAGRMLEVAPEDLMMADGAISVKGVPDSGITIREVAEAAHMSPQIRQAQVDEGEEDVGLTVTRFYDPKATYANGCILALVAVDIETGGVTVERVVAVEDCGTIINPRIVDGQIRGAVAQGIGGALLESIVYGDDGQILTSTFVDYLLPTANDIPTIEVAHISSPSPVSVGGIKGVGEAGLIATPAAIANAVADALSPFGAGIRRLPLSPEEVCSIIKIGHLDTRASTQ
jgi:carbon-monoxide dehydrogenase large subunit